MAYSDASAAARFTAVAFPCSAEIAALEQLTPFSPFNTAAYAEARAAMGEHPYVLGIEQDGRMRSGCLALLTRGRLTRRLTIPSLPGLSREDPFFEGLVSFCRDQRVWDLDIGSFGSQPGVVPVLGRERGRRPRCEFVLDLAVPDPLAGISTNHRRSARRAAMLGVVLRRSREPEAVQHHLAAIEASLERRSKRGEWVVLPGSGLEAAALVRSGAGEVYQAVMEGQVVSSILILKSAHVAYYHSAGTTLEGMSAGASAFLICAVATELEQQGLREFNLGGAEPANTGLFRFKSGFGTILRELEQASFTLASPLLVRLRNTLGSLLRRPHVVLTAAQYAG